MPACLDLLSKWKAGYLKGECFDLPITESLTNLEALGLRGAAVTVNGRVEGFTIGEMLDDETAIIYIEVTNPEMEGLAQYINQRSCQEDWAAAKFINREQDLGDAGLRRAKMSYHPVKFVDKYDVTAVD